MSSETLNQCVFVYGTLKQGFCRHHAIADQIFLGVAVTEPAYRLFDLGEYPGLIAEAAGKSIGGELYRVNEKCLQKLDVVEGVSDGLYSRQTVRLLPPWSDQQAVTYIYEQSVSGYQEIPEWPWQTETQSES